MDTHALSSSLASALAGSGSPIDKKKNIARRSVFSCDSTRLAGEASLSLAASFHALLQLLQWGLDHYFKGGYGYDLLFME